MRPWVVAVGASAGGLEALQGLFGALEAPTHAAFVVIQHLSPDHKSMMDNLLARHTVMPVIMAANHTPCSYRFGRFELQLDERRLLRNGTAVPRSYGGFLFASYNPPWPPTSPGCRSSRRPTGTACAPRMQVPSSSMTNAPPRATSSGS